ncbi:hypothetical protein NKH10_28305 [Mesorhizobium sp. M1340]|uniref:hypothetical protein n=1 Tax=unclassified Mesorhizobium TaxID=325217 RepID=UPI00333568E5
MVVAAELTLAGVPALKVPDNWPGYDVIAQPVGYPPQRVSVKSRTFKPGPAYVTYYYFDQFDWLAIVILLPASANGRAVYLIPKDVSDELARRDKPTSKTAAERYFRVDQVEHLFLRYRNNYRLSRDGDANAVSVRDEPAGTPIF